MFVLLNPDFNFSSSFVYLESIELLLKHRVLCVIANVPILVKSVITQFTDQVSCRLIPQLIKGISRVLQTLLRYFNGTNISTSFVLPARGLLPVILALMLNYLESFILVILP